MIRTVIFDVDGTLLNTETIYIRAWIEAGESLGYTIPMEALMRTRAVNRTVSKSIFQQYCGEDFDYEAVWKVRIRISEQIIQSLQADALLMPHARQTLQWLKDQGFTLAAASSTEYNATRDHLERAGIFDLFSAVLGGDMITRGKPQPDIFLKAAELTGTEPEQCIVVGDTPADVLAGSAAGMKVVLIPDQVPANAQTTELSWKVLSGLDQLPAAVKKLKAE